MSNVSVITDSSSSGTINGERVVALMYRHHLTQKSLAGRIGVDPNTISRKLTGNRGWTLADAMSLAQVLETSVAYLIGEVDDDRPLKTRKAASVETETAPGVAREGLDPSTSRL